MLAFAVPFVVLGAAVVVPAAAAEPLRANVVSVAPNDIDEPDVPVSMVFRLYEPELPTAKPGWGKPLGGVNDVDVVIRGAGQTHRFRAEDLGGGRYRTEIVFPEPGGWSLRVSYGAGSYGPGDEIGLGKGGICIAADCVGAQPGEIAPAETAGRPWARIAAAAVAAVLLFGGVAVPGAVARRRRGASTA